MRIKKKESDIYIVLNRKLIYSIFSNILFPPIKIHLSKTFRLLVDDFHIQLDNNKKNREDSNFDEISSYDSNFLACPEEQLQAKF